MSKKPIKSNLFRFVTLRSPQLIEDKETGFVSFPEEKKAESLAFKSVENVTSDAERTTALKGAYNNTVDFTPIASRLEIKNLHPELYQFSGWLMRNKNVLSYASIEVNLSEAQELTTNEEFVLWENLFHQTIDKESVAVREALIQVLVADKFLKAFNVFTNSFTEGIEGEIVFTEENEKEFLRLANASVIVPKEVIIAAQNEFSYVAPIVSKSSQDYMQAQLEIALAKDRIQLHEAALKDLEYAETLYRKAEKIRYETELQAYNTTIDQLQQDAVPEIQTVFYAETGSMRQVKTYPDLQLPEFEFESAVEIDKNLGTTTLSAETLNLLNANSLSLYDTFGEVKPILKDRIKKDYQLVYDAAPQEAQKVSVGDTTVTLSAMRGAQLYSYSGSIKPSTYTDKNVISMSMNVGYANAYVKSATYELKDNSGNTITGSAIKKLSSTENLLNIQFFPAGTSLVLGEYTFSGELVLSNGETVQFSSLLPVIGKLLEFEDQYYIPRKREGVEHVGSYSGIGTKALESGEPTTGENAAEDTENTVLYGVSQLGIADFRRVEQEVCCYVPGEVSHIENIMAREYKERSTRDLRVSETTTETATEKEVENLTDTTSTERNELQSEASSIVNSDSATSFGANASVSGGGNIGPKYSFGTNFNSSSSNSTSNSNIQAQTYAQEVTERALERVVQKVSTKRTSRMLREFEENNTHGFDNRKGDKHVTGVYRWVDKIYKNKLINYGKRLMYEFALPEPAKFYIDSYFKKGDGDEKTAEGLIIPKKPVHPSDLDKAINSAKELTEDNYQFFTSKYGAEALPYPKDFSLSKGLKITCFAGREKQKYAVVSEEIEIPEGYLCKKGYSNGQLMYHLGKNEWAKIIATMGDVSNEHLCRYNGSNDHGANISLNLKKEHDLGKSYSRKIAISAMSFDSEVESIANFVLDFELSEEGKQQWQNETYKAIMDAYQERLNEYNDFIKSQATDEKSNEKKKELSSQINRSIEKRELKRIAISLMKHKNVEFARDNYDGESSKNIARTPEFQTHAETVKFFEQAFDWEIMAYTFYPYFYADENDWDANFEYNEGSDPIFQAFLQSGMARSVVPVRPGFEEAVNWYMKTGEIWNGQGMVTDMDDDLYVSVAEEMQTIEGEVEGTWETRVPTTLTVLQADSVVLNEGGLPCNPDCEGQGLFDVSTYKIGDGPDGVDYDIVGDTNNVA